MNNIPSRKKDSYKKPTCYQLIGVPGSGKSTWVREKGTASLRFFAYISTDIYVENYAAEHNKTYNDVFKDYMSTAVELMLEDVRAAHRLGVDVIWDQTNLTVESRRKKFQMLQEYDHIAVVFKTPDRDEHQQRLSSRYGKRIPDAVMSGMIQSFQLPELCEGFSEIIIADNVNCV